MKGVQCEGSISEIIVIKDFFGMFKNERKMGLLMRTLWAR